MPSKQPQLSTGDNRNHLRPNLDSTCFPPFPGSSGSCLRRFSPMPFMFCNIHGVCTYASRTATSFWLSTGEPVPMMPVTSQEGVRRHIGRCSVCQAHGPLLTLHTQSSTPATCPGGWAPIWEGYSFIMVIIPLGFFGNVGPISYT